MIGRVPRSVIKASTVFAVAEGFRCHIRGHYSLSSGTIYQLRVIPGYFTSFDDAQLYVFGEVRLHYEHETMYVSSTRCELFSYLCSLLQYWRFPGRYVNNESILFYTDNDFVSLREQ